MLRIETPHQLFLSTHDPNRHSTAKRLAVHHHVRVHSVIFLRASGCHPKARVHLVEHEGHVALSAHLTDLLEPHRVRIQGLGRRRLADGGGHEHHVVGGGGIRIEPLQGVDNDARNLGRARADGGERRGGHVLEAQDVGVLALVAGAGLDTIPPAVIGTSEAHDEFAAFVEGGEAHSTHDGFGARHVERHLIQLGHCLDHCEIFAHDWMQGSEHRA
mmetsp:Transcript_21231/g.52440  ORF Transcript_21231/g.52440 Transcript_21231/m.52440 type:complete len:216 (+) Transcript_21231:1558-2205(+)